MCARACRCLPSAAARHSGLRSPGILGRGAATGPCICAVHGGRPWLHRGYGFQPGAVCRPSGSRCEPESRSLSSDGTVAQDRVHPSRGSPRVDGSSIRASRFIPAATSASPSHPQGPAEPAQRRAQRHGRTRSLVDHARQLGVLHPDRVRYGQPGDRGLPSSAGDFAAVSSVQSGSWTDCRAHTCLRGCNRWLKSSTAHEAERSLGGPSTQAYSPRSK